MNLLFVVSILTISVFEFGSPATLFLDDDNAEVLLGKISDVKLYRTADGRLGSKNGVDMPDLNLGGLNVTQELTSILKRVQILEASALADRQNWTQQFDLLNSATNTQLEQLRGQLNVTQGFHDFWIE